MSVSRAIKENILAIIAILYALVIFIVISYLKNKLTMTIHLYLTAFVSFWALCRVIRFVINEHDSGIRLYIALGISCLALGNLYFMLLDIVSVEPDVLSVGLFAKVCCYLFFISALTGLNVKKKSKRSVVVINIVSVISTIICAYAVIANDILVINISVLLLDVLCLILACSLMHNKRNIFFSVMMIVIVAFDFLSMVVILSTYLSLLSPALYILLSQAVITMKAGEQNA